MPSRASIPHSMVNGCQLGIDQSSSRAPTPVEVVGEACSVHVSQVRGRRKGWAPSAFSSPAVGLQDTQPDDSITVAGGFRPLDKTAWGGPWGRVTASCKYLESSGQQTKWSCMRGSNRPIFFSVPSDKLPKFPSLSLYCFSIPKEWSITSTVTISKLYCIQERIILIYSLKI